ncbi:flavodoxin family protein [Glycomyces albus]
MRAVVVYESMFGNTKQLAETVAAALAERMAVELVEVGEAPKVLDPEIGLLVVGAPTHAFSLSRPATREEAAKQAPHGLVSKGIGVREWLEEVEAPRGTRAAVFDTRAKLRVPGSAARAATRRLRRAGFRIAGRPESFSVERTPGPLVPGEAQRAHRWAAALASRQPTVEQ